MTFFRALNFYWLRASVASCTVNSAEEHLNRLLALQVSGTDLQNATHEEAVEAIKNAGNPIVFVVQSLSTLPRVSYDACCRRCVHF